MEGQIMLVAISFFLNKNILEKKSLRTIFEEHQRVVFFSKLKYLERFINQAYREWCHHITLQWWNTTCSTTHSNKQKKLS